VIAGIQQVAAITPLGLTWRSTWQALLTCGENNQGPVGSALPHAITGLDRSLGPTGHGAAARLLKSVVRDLDPATANEKSPPLYGGTTYGESDLLSQAVREGLETPSMWAGLLEDPIPSALAPRSVERWVYASCASGMTALVLAAHELSQTGGAVVVGVDALSALGIAGFARSGASTRERCLPFSTRRTGTTVAEGAAGIRLSSPGVPGSLGTILALSLTCDAGHPTQPAADGCGLKAAIADVLARAELDIDEIGGIVAHGTGTRLNDAIEAEVINQTFRGQPPPTMSVKGVMGHTMAASGLVNMLTGLTASCTGLLPPTRAEPLDPEPGVNLVWGEPTVIQRGCAVLVLNAAFGSINAAALVRGHI
jgi:hypothetical protein